ncbi:hypothetical protein AB0L99_11580 [Streptomyces sp. NPDC051954]
MTSCVLRHELPGHGPRGVPGRIARPGPDHETFTCARGEDGKASARTEPA